VSNSSNIKICGKCKVEKPISEFYTRCDTGGVKSKCKSCDKQDAVKWQKKEYYRNDDFRQASIDRMDVWRKENPDRNRELINESNARARNNLSDRYVKEVIVKHSDLLGRRHIPLSLVMAKRASLKIKRELRK